MENHFDPIMNGVEKFASPETGEDRVFVVIHDIVRSDWWKRWSLEGVDTTFDLYRVFFEEEFLSYRQPPAA